MQAVRIFASDSTKCKFYWLPPDKENTGLPHLFTILFPTLPEYSVCSTGEKQKGESTGIRHKYQGIRSKLDLRKISNGSSRVSQSHPFPSTLTTNG